MLLVVRPRHTWSDAVPLISESGYTTAVLLRSGKVLAVGGDSNSAEVYDGGFEIPRLTLNSTNYCTGDSWDLTVTNATPAASVHLMGVSNGASWEVAGWRTIDTDGGIRVSGTIADGTEGRQTLRVEISGILVKRILLYGVALQTLKHEMARPVTE